VVDGEDGYKSVSYMDWVPLLCGAVQSLSRQVQELEEQCQRLRINAGEE
jgi:hypothetical protein